MTPLHEAAGSGHVEVVKYITQMNCNPNTPNYKGLRPIHCAALLGHLNVLKYLVEDLTNFLKA